MPFDWGEKLVDLLSGIIPGAAKVLPEHWRRQAEARLRDFNPFAQIAANEDLLRALRLAWIEAAHDVDAAVQGASSQAEWSDSQNEVSRFSQLLRQELRALRSRSFNRDVHPGTSAIDEHLLDILIGVPDYVRAAGGLRPGDTLTQSFVNKLAAVTAWPEIEVPRIYGQLGAKGLPIDGGTENRAFGELVLASFAETLKKPGRYPEASEAFRLALGGLARELANTTLARVEGIDLKVDEAFEELRSLTPQIQAIESSVKRTGSLVEHSVKAIEAHTDLIQANFHAAAQTAARRHEDGQNLLLQVLDAIQNKGDEGSSAPEAAHKTLLAWARRLNPADLIDFDQAISELKLAREVALKVFSEGQAKTNQRFVDDAMARISELTEQGDIQKGADFIDEALAEISEREKSHIEAFRNQRHLLLEASIRQSVLLRDTERAVNAALQIAEFENPLRPAWTSSFQNRIKSFEDETDNNGATFPLQAALEMARLQLNTSENSRERGDTLHLIGRILNSQGGKDGNINLLYESLITSRQALTLRTRDNAPLAWAATQNNIGNTLTYLGEIKCDINLLQESIDAHTAALTVRNRDYYPNEWAQSHLNLSTAHSTLGSLTNNKDNWEAAKKFSVLALEFINKEEKPELWAALKRNQGIALHGLHTFNPSKENLDAALLALHSSQTIYEKSVNLLSWAGSQLHIGITLGTLGEFEKSEEHLRSSISHLRILLKEINVHRFPSLWSSAQLKLVRSMRSLGVVAKNEDDLRHAVRQARIVAAELDNDATRIIWIQNAIHCSDVMYSATRGDNPSYLPEAISICERVFSYVSETEYPQYWAWAKVSIGNALLEKGSSSNDTEIIEEARRASLDALRVYSRERNEVNWAIAKHNIGLTHYKIGEITKSKQSFDFAVSAFAEANSTYSREVNPEDWAIGQWWLGKTLFAIAKYESNTSNFKLAIKAFSAAMLVWTVDSDLNGWFDCKCWIAEAQLEIGRREICFWTLRYAMQSCEEALQYAHHKRGPKLWARPQLTYAKANLARLIIGYKTLRMLRRAASEFRCVMRVFADKVESNEFKQSKEGLEIMDIFIAQYPADTDPDISLKGDFHSAALILGDRENY